MSRGAKLSSSTFIGKDNHKLLLGLGLTHSFPGFQGYYHDHLCLTHVYSDLFASWMTPVSSQGCSFCVSRMQ